MPIKKAEYTGEVAARFLAEVDYLKKLHPDTLDKIKIDASYVSQIRGGKRFPTIDHLVTLCKEYGYSGTWLLTGVGEKKTEPENITLDNRLSKMEEHLSKLNAILLSEEKTEGHRTGHKNRKTGTK